ncbi:flagellar basal body P-ring formation chaperone FlgA [Achromobacter sp. AGC78]
MRVLLLPLLMLWSAMACASTPESTAVFLRAAVQVQNTDLTLGDVAKLDGSADQVASLARLPIGRAPVDNAVREIGREELQRWIDTALEPVGPVTWRGNSSVRVTRKVVSLDRNKVTEAAIAAAVAALRTRYRKFDVESAGNLLPQQVAAGQYQARPRAVELSEVVPSRLVVWVELWHDKGLYRALPIALNVRAFAPVLQLNADVAAGASLSSDDVSVQEVDVASLTGAYWPADTPLHKVRAKQSLAAGAVLLRAQLQALPDVERGDHVALRVRSGSVVIETTAQALQDGWVDRSVRVRPNKAEDTVLAKVVRTGLVEIQE